MKKRLATLLLATILLLAVAVPALAKAPAVKEVEYQGGKTVEVEFAEKVSYRNPKITVKDSDGNKLTAKIVERDSDDLTFTVTGLAPGGKYTFALSGIRAGKSGKYGTVKGSFSVPAKLAIRKVKYDAADEELDIDFNGRVKYRKVKVTVTDASGRKYAAKIVEKGSDDLEVKVAGLEKGAKYKVTVSGVALKGGKYTTVSKSFTVREMP